ncbi:hypothetical protein SUGI_0820690 [Cryptomeria japonica]|nr:hypothetical protein SUGI_0820690 [Cryptomeria japonica]
MRRQFWKALGSENPFLCLLLKLLQPPERIMKQVCRFLMDAQVAKLSIIRRSCTGPYLRCFGIKGNRGLKDLVEETMWSLFDRVGSGELLPETAIFNSNVPSRSLWTGWIDSTLNALYLTRAFREAYVDRYTFVPKCAGYDNLTQFNEDVEDRYLWMACENLNQMFNAGIEKEKFLIHRGEFYVMTKQASYSPGTDLSLGTLKLKDLVQWRIRMSSSHR